MTGGIQIFSFVSFSLYSAIIYPLLILTYIAECNIDFSGGVFDCVRFVCYHDVRPGAHQIPEEREGIEVEEDRGVIRRCGRRKWEKKKERKKRKGRRGRERMERTRRKRNKGRKKKREMKNEEQKKEDKEKKKKVGLK